jgi:predicted DCC family thiol-disulfide oxidoreductase YuxK
MEASKRVGLGTRGSGSIQVFFDGDCPLCKREIAFLSRRDTQGRIIATDIAEPSFDASQHGRSHTEFMATIQGRLADGRWITGVEVFRQLYSAVGFKRLVRISRVRPIAWVLNHAYAVFAKHRLRLTGRCETGACAIPSSAVKEHDEGIVSTATLVREPRNSTIPKPDKVHEFLPGLPHRTLRSSSRRLN